MLTDYPKYIGFEGHPESFARPLAGEPETFASYDFTVAAHEYPAASAALNHQFSISNENWNDKEHDHMSELYVRVRDLEPLVKVARQILANDRLIAVVANIGNSVSPCPEELLLREALTKLADIP